MTYSELLAKCFESYDIKDYEYSYKLITSMKRKFWHRQLYGMYALVCFKVEKYDEMLEYALAGIAQDPHDTDAMLLIHCYYAAGIAYGKLGGITKSTKYFKVAIEMNPENETMEYSYQQAANISKQIELYTQSFNRIY